MIVWLSHGWPPRKSCTKRTPRSTSRRAIRQRVPYSRVCVVVQAVERFDVTRARARCRAPPSRPSAWRRPARSLDPGFEIGLARVVFEVPPVQPVEELEILALGFAAEMGRRVEIEDPRLLRPQHRPLIHRRHEPARPVVRSVDRVSAGVGQDHIGWELF